MLRGNLASTLLLGFIQLQGEQDGKTLMHAECKQRYTMIHHVPPRKRTESLLMGSKLQSALCYALQQLNFGSHNSDIISPAPCGCGMSSLLCHNCKCVQRLSFWELHARLGQCGSPNTELRPLWATENHPEIVDLMEMM